jgi:hypothetical protein
VRPNDEDGFKLCPPPEKLPSSVCSWKMTDRKLDLTVGQLPPILNDRQQAALRRLADNFSRLAPSGVKGQRKFLN